MFIIELSCDCIDISCFEDLSSDWICFRGFRVFLIFDVVVVVEAIDFLLEDRVVIRESIVVVLSRREDGMKKRNGRFHGCKEYPEGFGA